MHNVFTPDQKKKKKETPNIDGEKKTKKPKHLDVKSSIL